ncbi:MAG: hypothetical protein Q7T18_06030, partial [Sedimentisphaerales bacterium]|nr:hypothetical protein [Sedimentisphaerales bacterium]
STDYLRTEFQEKCADHIAKCQQRIDPTCFHEGAMKFRIASDKFLRIVRLIELITQRNELIENFLINRNSCHGILSRGALNTASMGAFKTSQLIFLFHTLFCHNPQV